MYLWDGKICCNILKFEERDFQIEILFSNRFYINIYITNTYIYRGILQTTLGLNAK